MKKLTLTLNVPDDFDPSTVSVQLTSSDTGPEIAPEQPHKPEKFRMELGNITVTQTAAMPLS